MKVCLIYPSIRNFGGFNSLGKQVESVYINHGLASISAVLKQCGHEASLIDLRECQSWHDVYHQIGQCDADIYAVYMSTLDFYEAKKCAELIHKHNKVAIAGGPHPSICPEHTLENTDFDFVFVGEAEKTLPAFLENIDGYGRLVIGEQPDLDSLPYEDRELFNMEKVLGFKHPFFPSPFLTVISGRGCPYNCSFCKPGEDKIFGEFRMRSIPHFTGEIELLAKQYDYNMLWIDDDSFTVSPNYVQEFCDSYEKIGRPFTCQTRVNFIVNHPDLIERMKEIGLWMLTVGFESGSQRILNLYRKGTTVEQNLEAAKICHKHDVKIWANIMFGAPTESKKEMQQTFKMVEQIRPYHLSPTFYTPIFGTALYDYCKNNDVLLSDDPTNLGTRSATKPKIKNVDYGWLRKQLWKMRVDSLKYVPIKIRIKKVVEYGLARALSSFRQESNYTP